MRFAVRLRDGGRTLAVDPARSDHSLAQFDRIEINEAFAAQMLAVTRSLGLADSAEHVNCNGGAIALGHPLGAGGARLVLTAMHEIASGAARNALVALCVGLVKAWRWRWKDQSNSARGLLPTARLCYRRWQ